MNNIHRNITRVAYAVRLEDGQVVDIDVSGGGSDWAAIIDYVRVEGATSETWALVALRDRLEKIVHALDRGIKELEKTP